MNAYLRLLRPQQWIKNIFVFAGLIFSRQFHDATSLLRSAGAFIVFSLLSSGGYIINDVLDYREDRFSPAKSKRPVASGAIARGRALGLGILLIAVSVALSFFINRYFLVVGLVYLALMVLYSLKVKQVVLLDVLFVAIAYVLRSVAGAVAIKVEISSWLIVCSFLLALFMVLTKRRGEMLGENARNQRKVLAYYSTELLDQLIVIAVSACIVSYCIYTLAPETVIKFHTKKLVYTVPIVIYALFRYLYISREKAGSAMPDRLLFTDAPLLISVILWAGACILLLF